MMSYQRRRRQPVEAPAQVMIQESSEIIGDDNRQRIRRTTAQPFRSICKLEIRENSVCTGALIAPNKVLTAAHCLTSTRALTPEEVVAIPGKSGSGDSDRSEPYGFAFAQRFQINPNFIKARTDSDRVRSDYAVITLDRDIGHASGWWRRIRPLSDSTLLNNKVNTAGYPLSQGGDRLCWDYQSIAAVRGRIMTLLHDVEEGQSGGPIWIRWRSSRAIVGLVVHHQLDTTSIKSNTGLRITPQVLADINSWLRN